MKIGMRRWGLAAVIGFSVLGSTGCAVKAYERENLVDPIMQFQTDAKENAREMKWLEAREASTGGVGGAGGGCACN